MTTETQTTVITDDDFDFDMFGTSTPDVAFAEAQRAAAVENATDLFAVRTAAGRVENVRAGMGWHPSR